jgi:ABC-type multidrug transport system ATPase subunit
MAPIIEGEALTRRFRATVVLDGLDLTSNGGGVLAVLGPNGAGKSTFIRCVSTLIQPDSGSLRVFGRDVVREPHRGLQPPAGEDFRRLSPELYR